MTVNLLLVRCLVDENFSRRPEDQAQCERMCQSSFDEEVARNYVETFEFEENPYFQGLIKFHCRCVLYRVAV